MKNKARFKYALVMFVLFFCFGLGFCCYFLIVWYEVHFSYVAHSPENKKQIYANFSVRRLGRMGILNILSEKSVNYGVTCMQLMSGWYFSFLGSCRNKS